MSKIPAFTLMETMITLSVIIILMLIGSNVVSLAKDQLSKYRSQTNQLNNIMKAERFISIAFENAQIITKKTEGFEIVYYNNNKRQFNFLNNGIATIQNSIIDTLNLEWFYIEYKYANEIINMPDQVIDELTIKCKANKLLFHLLFHKHYGADILMNYIQIDIE